MQSGIKAYPRLNGFTLAELLIALAILGVIATFTIPKILQAQQNQQYTAITKEVVATISGAYQAYQVNNTAGSATSINNLTPYINYVKYDTGNSTVNGNQVDAGSYTCSALTCLKFHNGASMFWGWNSFGATAGTSVVWFAVDPDGVADNVHSARFWLYFNGRISDEASILPNSCDSGSCGNPCPSCLPPWFNWN